MFQVDWLQTALDDLASAWVQAVPPVRQAITSAAHRIEQRLRRDPHNEGESRPSGRRVTFEPPLTVTFRVEADGQTVTIIQVRAFRRRKA